MPKSKKNRMRFSLSMNENDPVQAAAGRVLNSKGRSISEFVAQAIVAYLGGNPNEIYLKRAVVTSSHNEKTAPPQTLTKPPQAPPSKTELPACNVAKPPAEAPENQPVSEPKAEQEPVKETMMAMLDGMADML
ncbi:MAG: hypothetical protein ABF449_13690 [Ethanoligenens sp.]